MWRIIALVSSGLIVSACGGGIGSYEEGMEAYSDVMQEMISVLEDVDDESSAKKAAGKIEDLGTRMAEISEQLADLPRPSAKEMQELAKHQRAEMQNFQQNAAEQMMKMMQYPELMDAWMRALQNMK